MDNPDKYIEEFWLGLKQSMNNFYKEKKISRPINYWSNNLNELQKNKNYDIIEEKIRGYISLYAIDIMRCNDKYNIHILLTNIKRWNNISNKYKFENNNNGYHNIVFLLLDLYKSFLTMNIINYEYYFEQIELFILYEDFTPFIKFAIENYKPNMLEKINKYCNVYNIIEELYNIKIDNKSCFKKCLDRFFK
jgi:hypothetical protein